MEYSQIKRKIKREKANKKWTDQDVKTILNYLQDVPELEVPTAQIFYKKLIEVTGIEATWDLVKWKVRYLKSNFKKANDWQNSTGAGLLESDLSSNGVEAKVLQMCPHYQQLSEIFGEKIHHRTEYNVIDTGDPATLDESMCSVLSEATSEPTTLLFDPTDFELNITPEVLMESECNELNSDPSVSKNASNARTSSTPIPKKSKEFAEKMKKFAPKSSSECLAAFQKERTEMFRMKFEWEKTKHDKDLELSEKKLAMEEEKTKAEIEFRRKEIELRQKEIEKDERLKILEMEKEERLKIFELELKYKYKSAE